MAGRAPSNSKIHGFYSMTEKVLLDGDKFSWGPGRTPWDASCPQCEEGCGQATLKGL